MGLARFLQVSDFHLGRPLGWLPADKRTARRMELRAVLERTVRIALERDVHAILLPGDLFDSEGVDADTLAYVVGDAFKISGCPPVFIAPGNHDPWFERSAFWDPSRLRARGLEWPAHVHVFRTPEWSFVEMARLEGVRIWGRCFTSGVESLERPLHAAVLEAIGPRSGPGFDIGLFHGSQEGACPKGQKITAPFSEDEARNVPFAYVAVGHYHKPTKLTASGGSSTGVRLAYAGSPAVLDMRELGIRGGLEVRIEYGSGEPFVDVEMVELDRRRALRVPVDISNCNSAERVDARVQLALDEHGAGERDLVRLALEGRLGRGVRYTGPAPEIASRFYHLETDLTLVRPDHDLEGLMGREPSTTEERFAQVLLGRLEAEPEPARRAEVESALYYGLDALRLGEVTPAYEELGEPEDDDVSEATS